MRTQPTANGPLAQPPRVYPEVVPQVGANLYLDTALDPPHLECGNRHWLLSGSCVLVAPGEILTIHHALGRKGRYAAFFPFEGIVLLKGDPVRQIPRGDGLVLATLEREIETVAPLPYWKVWKRFLQGAQGWVGGFGDWKGVPGAEEDGLQRLVRVQLGRLPKRYEGRKVREDNLDISWWSPYNDDVEALLDNSGGPLLRSKRRGSGPPFGVIGITREHTGPQQVCSWITQRRDFWLRKYVGRLRWARPRVTPWVREARHLVVGRAGHLERLRVPSDATRVKATLSATGGMRLQMKIGLGAAPEGVATDYRTSGRFLCREEPLDRGTEEIVIGIMPVAGVPAEADRVDAQLCCMFT